MRKANRISVLIQSNHFNIFKFKFLPRHVLADESDIANIANIAEFADINRIGNIVKIWRFEHLKG
jgi:hypothetical protein